MLIPGRAELNAIWYDAGPVPLRLRGPGLLYALLTALRRGLYRTGILRSTRLPVPVVVVGNISVGGTGKTPLVIALVEALRERGFRPGVVSRGYGGSADAAQRVAVPADPAVVGDEPVLIAESTGVPVAIGRKRVQAAGLLLDEIDVLIADDGLQHYALARDIEICVIDGARRFGNARLLPAGPLREPLSRLARVDFRVCNGGKAELDEVAMTLVGDGAVCVIDPTQNKPLEEFRGRSAHAVAGIGNPGRFFDDLRAAGIEVIEHPFADHHAHVPGDLDFGDELPVLMTAKDAVKCRRFAKPNWWLVPVRAALATTFFDAVAERCAKLRVQKSALS